MSERLPISTLLSQVLVAFTVEFDNEAERQFAASAPQWFLVSQVMWSNLMRFVDDEGVAVRHIPDRAGVPGTPATSGWIHTCLAGMERCGYVSVAKDPADDRPKPPRRDWLVRPTGAGRRAQEVWRPLGGVLEARRRDRFGDDVIGELRGCLGAVVGRLNVELPQYLPLMIYGDGMRTSVPHLEGWAPAAGDVEPKVDSLDVSALIARVLLLLGVQFERESALSLAISANALRVIGDDGVDVRELPAFTGVSKEAIKASLGYLERREYAVVEPARTGSRVKVVRLTATGRDAREATSALLGAIEERWRTAFGNDTIERLRASLEVVLDSPSLSEAMTPPPRGWRAQKPYASNTAATLRDARAALPHYPMILHRGGWPDGS